VIEELVLPSALRHRIEREARQAHPLECCGLIEGVRRGARVIATHVHPVANVAVETDRFAVAPADQFRIQKQARHRGHAIVGCYHSHPGGRPEPSPSDRQNPGADDFIWLIAASGGGGEIRAFAAGNCDLQSLNIAEPAFA
jgi:proteasome lid subunit RPN8/RPN11